MRFDPESWRDSLALKILLAYVVGTCISIALLIGGSAVQQDRLPGMELAERADELARSLLFDDAGAPTGFAVEEGHPLWIYDSLRKEAAYRVLDAQGVVRLASPGAGDWPAQPDVARLTRGRFAFAGPAGTMMGATEQVAHQGRTWFVQLAISNRLVDFLHQQFALPFIQLGITAFSLVLLFVFGACAVITLIWSLRPLRQASDAALAISPRSLQQRVDTARMPTEILPLVRSFNQALGRLERGYRLQQEFLATAAHELKTPLTLIRAEVELMDNAGDAHSALLKYTTHAGRQVQQLLLLAEASEPLSYQTTAVDAYACATECARYLEPLAAQAGVDLMVTGSPGLPPLSADRGALFTLLKNLMENAIQHAPPGTTVHVDISPDRIRIRDHGPGASDETLSHLFTRFWRGAHRRDEGAGLGLAICKEIALAHDWRLVARSVHPGLQIDLLTARPPH